MANDVGVFVTPGSRASARAGAGAGAGAASRAGASTKAGAEAAARACAAMGCPLNRGNKALTSAVIGANCFL